MYEKENEKGKFCTAHENHIVMAPFCDDRTICARFSFDLNLFFVVFIVVRLVRSDHHRLDVDGALVMPLGSSLAVRQGILVSE